MSSIENRQMSFERQVFAALQRSAKLAREETIKTETAIVVKPGGEVSCDLGVYYAEKTL